MADITAELKKLADADFRAFHLHLIPGVPPESVLGVRMPALRALAKGMTEGEKQAFVAALPHGTYDENVLHSIILSGIRDFDEAEREVARFLPYVDNWAVCDALAPKAFGKRANGARVREFAYECTLSSHLYTARFGLNCLRMYFLDNAFTPEILERAAAVSGSYYLDMAAAWFFCDALIKRWDETLPYFERGALPREVHLKAVRKAIESFRVPEERKLLLRSLPAPAK